MTARHLPAAVALALAMLAATSPSAQTPALPVADDAEVTAKGIVDDYEHMGTGKAPPARAGDEEARKRYSPYAGKRAPTHVYFGDTHNHTANSGDAFMGGDRLGPEQAYRLARGE